MKHYDFMIGQEFWNAHGRWRCTDVGMRTIIAIQIDPVHIVQKAMWATEPDTYKLYLYEEAVANGWLNGPPYSVEERVFNEADMRDCFLTEKEAIEKTFWSQRRMYLVARREALAAQTEAAGS